MSSEPDPGGGKPNQTDGGNPGDADGGNSGDADGGYVHRPEGDAGGAVEEDDDLGRTGWLLVGVVFVAFLAVPGAIYLYPLLGGSFGLPFLTTYLVLPLLPAVGLGVIAVWTLTATGGSGGDG